MSFSKRLLLSILFILFVGVSIAQTTGFWPITSVDLYQRGALVQHSDSVLFEGEMTEVVIDGLATNINRQSFQVDLPIGIILDELEFKTIQIENFEDNGLKSLNDSIYLLTFQIQMFESLLNTLNEERAFLQANRKIGSDQEVLLVDDLIEMADFLRERNQDLGLEILDVHTDINNAQKQLDKLKKRKSLIKISGSDLSGSLTLNLSNISANRRTEYITIKYLTTEASWTTKYNLYLEEGEVFVKRQARIQQNSGIDWNGVNVELISGHPEKSLKPNGFEDWVIEESSNTIDVDRAMSSGAISQQENNIELEYDKSISFAGDTRYRFNVEKPVTLISSPYKKVVEVDEFVLEGDIEYYAAPAQNSSAYAIVKCSDWADKKLMNGRADVVTSNSYLGWYHLRLPIVGDTLNVNLGNDPHVMCSRELLSESSTVKRFAGKKQVVQTWELSVENSNSDTIKVNLADKLPRANNSDIDISAVTEDGGELDSALNEINFDFELSPLERRTVTYILTVTYPSFMNLKNL